MTKTGNQPPDGPDTAGGSLRPLHIIQLTDLHLYADAQGRLLGQNTRLTFESVLAVAQRGDWPPDALVLTGDLIHDESTEGYRFLRQRIEQLGVPFFAIPGNHDRIDLMAGHFDAGATSGFRVESLGRWDLLLLDSTIPLEAGGHLKPIVLAELDRYASANPRRHLLIFLHHHPEPVGSAWIDTMLVDNGSELLASAAAHPNIRGIACGHVHQAREASPSRIEANAIDWMSTPSTCVQFLPHSKAFALDKLKPGYRRLDLYPDGRIETRVVRTHDYPDPLLPSTSGY